MNPYYIGTDTDSDAYSYTDSLDEARDIVATDPMAKGMIIYTARDNESHDWRIIE